MFKNMISIFFLPSIIPSRIISVPWSTIIPVRGETNLGAVDFLVGFDICAALTSFCLIPSSSWDITTVFSWRISPGWSWMIFSCSSTLYDCSNKVTFDILSLSLAIFNSLYFKIYIFLSITDFIFFKNNKIHKIKYSYPFYLKRKEIYILLYIKKFNEQNIV